MTNRIRFGWIVLAIIALTAFGLYWDALHHPFAFDDISSIVENPHIRNLRDGSLLLEGIRKQTGIYRTLPTISFAIQYHFHRLRPFGYRLVNLILHIFSGLLVYCISKHLFRLETWMPGRTGTAPGGAGKGDGRFFPLLVALIFITHPIQVNTVTYIVQRNEGMAGFFYLLTFLLFIKGSFAQGWKKRFLWCGAGLTLLGSVFSKEIGLTLPVPLILFDLIYVCRTKEDRIRRVKIYLPLFTVFLIYGLFFLKGGMLRPLMEGSPVWKWSPREHLLTEANVLVQYFKRILLPFPGWLNIDHDFPISKTLFEYPTWVSAGIHTGLLLLAVLSIRRWKGISFSIFWFYIILSPTSSFIPIWDVMVEYRLYLPLFACALVLAMGYDRLHRFLLGCAGGSFARYFVGGLVLLMLGFFSFVTLERNRVFQDDLTLWTDAAKKSPNKTRPRINLVAAYNRLGNYDLAIAESLSLIQKVPNNSNVLNKLGVAYMFKGEFEQAAFYFQRSIQTREDNPVAYNNLGALFLRQKDLDRAVEAFRKALQHRPAYTEALNNLSRALALRGDLDQAIEHQKKAVQIEPDLPEYRYNLARFYEDKGLLQEAIRTYREALALDPKLFDALLALGVLHSRMGNAAEAIYELEKAKRLNPGSGRVHFMLGVNFIRVKEYPRAIQSLELALRLSTNDKERQAIEAALKQLRSRP